MHDTGCCQDRFLVSISWCMSEREFVVSGWWEADQLALFEDARPGPAERVNAMTPGAAIMVARSMHLAAQERLKSVSRR